MLWKLPVQEYKKLHRNAVTKDYKKSDQNAVQKANYDTLKLVECCEPGLETNLEVIAQLESFSTVKGHKETFPAHIEVRTIKV